MLGLSLWEGRLPGQKTIENEDKGSHCSYRPESNFGTSDTVMKAGGKNTHQLALAQSGMAAQRRTSGAKGGS